MQLVIVYTPQPRSQRFKLYIPYAMEDDRKWIKSQNSSFYHPTQKLWSLINTKENKRLIATRFKGRFTVQGIDNKIVKKPKVVLDESQKNAMALCEQKFILKSFSRATIKNYLGELSYFFSFFKSRDFREITKDEIESYVYHLKTKFKISDSKQNMVINAIKAYYEHVLGRPREYYDIQRPNKSKSLPNIFSKEEVLKIVTAPKNIKHKAVLLTIYSAGLRISEAINLRIADIHSDEGYIFVKDSKGKKDRKTVL